MEILRRETDYALRALALLGNGGEMVSTRRLAEQCRVTVDHIRKIMPKLARAGLVVAARGSTGGFRLSRPLSEIRLADVVAATQGRLVLNVCVEHADCCCYHPNCPIAAKVNGLQKEIDVLTERTTLADLMTTETRHIGGKR